MVKITELAAQKVKEVLKAQNKENAFLRIYPIGEGCSGPNFGMTLEDSKTEDDMLDVEYGVSILMDIELAPTLEGAILDYIESDNGGGFEIRKVKTDHAEGCSGGCPSCENCHCGH